MTRREWPARIAGTESLLGTSRRFTPGSAPPRPDAAAMASPALLSRAIGAGATAVLAAPGESTDGLLARGAPRGAEVFALLPNIPAYVRDSSDLGLMGAALLRVRSAGPATLARLSITGLQNAPRILSRDFAGMLCLLLELEAARMSRHRPRAVFLAAALTDLALSAGNRGLFEHYAKFVHGRFGVPAGLETHNLGHLLARVREWGSPVDVVAGPVNPRGFMMKPRAEDVLSELRRATCPVLAKDPTAAGTVELEEGERYAREAGASGCIVDLTDLAGPPA